MITRDEVVLTVSPPGVDGRTWSLIGRGLCYAPEEGGPSTLANYGPTRQEPNPPP